MPHPYTAMPSCSFISCLAEALAGHIWKNMEAKWRELCGWDVSIGQTGAKNSLYSLMTDYRQMGYALRTSDSAFHNLLFINDGQ